MNFQAAYSRYLLQKEMISVANEVQSNNDPLHVDVIEYYYATINPRKQDNMARDRHLQSSRQHDVQVHPLSTVSKTHPYRLCEYDTATGEYACILYREDALNFIHSYNVRGPGIQEDFSLWLVDSGTTSFLSRSDLHQHPR